jgi:protein-S-isoprenylcysteine O-methyltransferase Ste14
VSDGIGIASRLARVRVPAGFVLGVLALWLARPTMATLAWGAGVACAGEALRVWAAGHLNKAREVTNSGPYRWIGHPLYLGSSAIGVGLAVASNSAAVTAVVAVYLAVMIPAAIRSEEAHLRAAFGDEYAAYQRGAASVRSRQPFSAARVVANHEPRTVAGLLVALLLLLLKATYNGSFWRGGG